MAGFGTATAAAVGALQVVYLGAMATLGVRLLLLARRTREIPETLLAAHFLLCCVLGYALQGSGHTLALQTEGSRASALLLGAGYALSLVGVGAVAGFNYWVFRRGTRLGQVLLAAVGIAMAVGWAGWVATGGPRTARPAGAFYWILYGAYTATALWTLVEPLAYYAAMRRRLRLGLADPLVVNRLLLWGLGSLARFGMLAVGVYALLELTGSPDDVAVAAPTFLVTGAVGLCVALAYWLAFFPPRAYLRRITAGSASA